MLKEKKKMVIEIRNKKREGEKWVVVSWRVIKEVVWGDSMLS